MTRSFLRVLGLLPVLFLALTLTACDSGGDDDPPPATTGTISGTIRLPAGAGGSLGNTRVAIYVDSDDLYDEIPLNVTTADDNGNFTFTNVNPGSYFMSAWKDNNNTTIIDGGDYFGVLGTFSVNSPFNLVRQQVIAGQTSTVNVEIQVLPAGYIFGVGLINATGTFSGTSQGTTLTVTLNDASGTISGNGTLIDGPNTFPFTVTGTRSTGNITLQISSQQLVPLTFTGTLADNGSSISGTLAGTATDGSPISVPFTLNRQ